MDLLKRKDIPFITVGLVVINVLVFLKLDILGNSLDPGYLYEHGGMYLPDVLDHGEWYRVFTHMFLHSGFEHLANNMVMLAAVGYIIENEYGKQEYTMAAEVKVQEFMIFVTLTVFIVSATGSKKDRISMR